MWEVWGWRLFGLFFAAIGTVDLLNLLIWRVHGGLGISGVVGGSLLAWWCLRMARRANAGRAESGSWSPEPASSETIFVPLLDEGVEAWRPVRAARVEDGIYRVVDRQPDGEKWAFLPGDVVRCTLRKLPRDSTETTVLVAVARHASVTSVPGP